MTSEPRWDRGAVEDLQAGYDWYEERELGLGSEFAAEVFETLDRALRHPFVPKKYEHPDLPAEPGVRKIQLERFDEYGIVYVIVDDTFWVLAVAHAKRKPGYWLDRLPKIP